MLFYSFFKTLVGKLVIIETKNDVLIKGRLHSVDQYLNVKLTEVTAVEGANFPFYNDNQNSMFIRGSSVKMIQLPSEAVDTELLEEATRRELFHPERV